MGENEKNKSNEGSLLMRGGECWDIDKASDRFTALIKAGTDVSRKQALGAVTSMGELSDRIELFEVPANDRDRIMDEMRSDKDTLFCHHVYCAHNDPDPELNFQKGTYDANGHSEWFGYGKVNAAAAVRKARGLISDQPKIIIAEKIANLEIPDADEAGVVSRIIISQRGRIQKLKVSVDVIHTYIGDLTVRLISPNGDRVVLHQRAGG